MTKDTQTSVTPATDEQIAEWERIYAFANDRGIHTVVGSLIARIRASEPVWQDIATAPRDGGGKGTWGECGPYILATDGISYHVVFWNSWSFDDGDFHNDVSGLTHWMPLPEAPK